MKIAISRYELQPKAGSHRNVRSGALLQVTFKDGSIGYSDLHPWPEFGDVPLPIQLELLACGHYTPLVLRSFSFARIDADARKCGRHLFNNVSVPGSHFHLSDLLSSSDSDIESILSNENPTIKLKVGVDPAAEISLLNRWSKSLAKAGAKLRLDFSCRLTQETTHHYLDQIQKLRESIDFIEDPFTFQAAKWKNFRETTGVRLACDWDSLHALAHTNSCDVLVVKPAIQEIFPFLGKMRGDRSLVVTSYLDHPIGQLCAAYTAIQAAHQNTNALSLCGLLTHTAYEPNPFSSCLTIDGNRLVSHSKGYGWGFDDIIKGLVWRTIG